MQPFDALTVRAVLQEAKPLLVNRRVDKINQVGRDEVVISLRSRTGMSHFLLSAHASFGRLCLANMPQPAKRANPPNFCLLLRKHLTGATLVGVEQMIGERIVDVVFSCLSEVGAPSLKVVTAEIMGRHSNLILWDKESSQILGASHVVTREMSRQREVMAGLKYVRPPSQDKPNLFKLSEEEFGRLFDQLNDLEAGGSPPASLDSWLVNSFAGLGRHLADEIVSSITVPAGEDGRQQSESWKAEIWKRIASLQSATDYRPALRLDLTRYTVLSWWADVADPSTWKTFPSVNDMVDEYFHHQELRERFQQLKDRLSSELKAEAERLESRLAAAARYLESTCDQSEYKKFGDLILAHLGELEARQAELICPDLYAPDHPSLSIPLNPNASAVQNAQHYYRQFAKVRARQQAAGNVRSDAWQRLEVVRGQLESLEQAKTADELERLKETVFGHRLQDVAAAQPPQPKKKTKPRLLSISSSDGWTILVGRNRQENDELVSRLAQPQDIWMHVLGQGGAHVLIRVPSTKQEPPLTTLKEAAQAAARLSKAGGGGKVRVVYTQCRNVRKLSKNKPGQVRYENEKTMEVDTAGPMPAALRQLFAHRQPQAR